MSDVTERTVTRRGLLRGATATALLSASAAQASAQGTTHTVDMTDQLVFDPEEITIAPGDTVVWENVGTVGHSVTAYDGEIPGDAEFFASGGFGNEGDARSGYPQQGDIPGGESYQHTFEVEGDYDYFCIPHETVGMVGVVTVQPGGATEAPTVSLPQVPDSAKGLVIGTATAMISVLALAYFFIKYGGDYGEDQ